MTRADAMSRAQLKATQMTGVQARLVDPVVSVEHQVWATPLDESRQWQEPSVTARVWISGHDLAATPQPGWRLQHSGRVFAVIGVLANKIQDTVLDWRLDVGEVAA